MGNDGNTYITPKITPAPPPQPYKPRFDYRDLTVITMFRENKNVRDSFPQINLNGIDDKIFYKIAKMKQDELKKLLKICPPYSVKMDAAVIAAGVSQVVYADYDTVLTPVGAKGRPGKSAIPGIDIYKPLQSINSDRNHTNLPPMNEKDYLRIVLADKNKIEEYFNPKPRNEKKEEVDAVQRVRDGRDFCWPRKE